MDTMLEFLDRMLREVPSLTDMLTFFTKTKMDTIFHLTMLFLKEVLEALLPLILIYLSLESLDTNLVMLKLIQTLYVFGKLNLEILPTVLKLLLINSSALEKLNGMLKTVLLCYFLMVLMETVQNTPQEEWKDSFNCAIKMLMFQQMLKDMIVYK